MLTTEKGLSRELNVMRSKYDFGDDWDIDNKWTNLGKQRKNKTPKMCEVSQCIPSEALYLLHQHRDQIIHQLIISGYIVKPPIDTKQVIMVYDENESDETLQTPTRIWLSYRNSRVSMEISFGWYSMVYEYVLDEQSGYYWSKIHENGVKNTPPYIRCHTIFNRINGKYIIW